MYLNHAKPLAEREELAARLGAEARADALGRFAWERVAAAMLDRYRLESA